MISNLFLHIPIPLVYLALLEAETLLKFNDLCLGPARILLEFEKQDFILLIILSLPFMILSASLIPVADHDSGNLIWEQLGRRYGLSDLTFFWRVLWGALESDGVGTAALSSFCWLFLFIFRFTWVHLLFVWVRRGRIHTLDILLLKTILFCRIRSVLSSFIFYRFIWIFWFFSIFKSCWVLLESRLRSFLQKSVDTLIKIIRSHVVIDNAEASDIDSSLIGASIGI